LRVGQFDVELFLLRDEIRSNRFRPLASLWPIAVRDEDDRRSDMRNVRIGEARQQARGENVGTLSSSRTVRMKPVIGSREVS